MYYDKQNKITMLINETNIKQWNLKPGETRFNIDLSNINTQTFRAFLGQLDEEINILSAQKCSLSLIQPLNDVAVNKNSFWRTIKPLHTSGESRLQSTLNRSLILMMALTHKEIDNDFINDLNKSKDDIARDEPTSAIKTYDAAYLAKKSFISTDKANTQVILEMFCSLFSTRDMFQKPEGMKGRKYTP